MVYSIIIGIILTLMYLMEQPSLPSMYRGARTLFLILITGAFLATPFMVPVVREFSMNPDVFYAGDAEIYSVDLANYLLPNHLNPVLKPLAHALAGSSGTFLGNRCEGMAATGYVALLLIAFGMKPWKHSGRWVVLGVTGLVLSLGPTLHIAGMEFSGVPMPFQFFQHIPIFRAARVPGRFAVLVTFSVAIIATFGSTRLLRRVSAFHKKDTGVFIVLCSLIILEQLPIPIRTCSTHIPEALCRMRNDPSCTAILEWPMDATQSMMRQTGHQKPIIDGFIARLPPEVIARKQAFERLLLRCVESDEHDIFHPLASPFVYARQNGISHFILDLAQLERDVPDRVNRDAVIRLIRHLHTSPPVVADSEVDIFRIETPDAVFETPLRSNGWTRPICVGDRCGRVLDALTGTLEFGVFRDDCDIRIDLTYSGTGEDLTCRVLGRLFQIEQTGDPGRERSISIELPGTDRGVFTVRFEKPVGTVFELRDARITAFPSGG